MATYNNTNTQGDMFQTMYGSASAGVAPLGYHYMDDGSLMYGSEHQEGFNYTPDDVLMYGNGSNYVGYFNKTGGKLYTNRKKADNSVELFPKEYSLSKYIKNEFSFTRGSEDFLELSFNTEDLKFQPSEFINVNSINKKLEMLHQNFLDLYNFSYIRKSSIPFEQNGFIGLSSTDLNFASTNYGLGYTTNISGANETTDPGSNPSTFSDLKGFEVIGINRDTSDPLLVQTPQRYLTIFYSSSAIQFFSTDNITISANNIGDNQGSSLTFVTSADVADGAFSQKFQNITDITTNDRDTLFVCDSYHNQIYRIYIDPITNESRINLNNIDLLNTTSFKLNTGGTESLSGATHIYYFKDEIYTYNEGTKTIVVLKDNLAFSRSYNNKLFAENRVVDFLINPTNGMVHILLDNLTIIEIDHTFLGTYKVLKNRNFLSKGGISPYADDEVAERLILSQNDSSVYYIMTNFNVYKFLMTNNSMQGRFIGRFQWGITHGIHDTQQYFENSRAAFFDMKILPENEDRDSIYILQRFPTDKKFKVHRFNEPNPTVSVLNDRKFKIFDLDDIIVKDHLFNNITFNKSLKKLLYNLDNLSSNVISNLGYSYNSDKFLKYSNSVMLSSNLFIDKDANYFVGVNEPLVPHIFNRCVLSIYNYQKYVLENLKPIITNQKYPLTEVVTF